jgi:hypothetical protein
MSTLGGLPSLLTASTLTHEDHKPKIMNCSWIKDIQQSLSFIIFINNS